MSIIDEVMGITDKAMGHRQGHWYKNKGHGYQ